MVTTGALIDPVPGNIGLALDADTVLLLRFDEPAGVRPSDAAGNLEDFALANPAGAAATVVDTVAWASATTWLLGPDSALSAVDRTGRDSLLQRDASVQAIWSSVAIGYEQPLVRRGSGGSAPEYRSLSIDVDTLTTPGSLLVRWSWQDSAGVLRADSFVTIPWVAGQLLLLTCTRRWVSSTEVVLRYYAGDTLIAESTSVYGDIAGSTAGTMLIGGADFEGYLDELRIVGREISQEELRATWARLTVHQPGGVATFRSNAPPGAPWFTAPTSGPALLARVAGQAIGHAASKAHELRETFLPDSAYADTLARWERLVGAQSQVRWALADRRTAVTTRLQRENGYSPPAVQDVLAVPFDLAAADVEILEFSPTITDAFTAIAPERWQAADAGSWTIASGELQLDVGAGTEASTIKLCHLLTPVDDQRGVILQVAFTQYWSAPREIASTAIVGLYLCNKVTGDRLWFGVKNDAGTLRLGWVDRIGGMLGTFTSLAGPVAAVYYLRITQDPDATFVPANKRRYNLWYSTVGFDDVGVTTAIDSIENVEHAGFGAVATATPIATPIKVNFDSLTLRIPYGDRAFHWYAYRDTGLSGDEDLAAAQALIPTLKPAHTHAAAITSLSLLCDDSSSGCDRGPMGGL